VYTFFKYLKTKNERSYRYIIIIIAIDKTNFTYWNKKYCKK